MHPCKSTFCLNKIAIFDSVYYDVVVVTTRHKGEFHQYNLQITGFL